MATTPNVRVTGPLQAFIARNIGEDGLFENASEYVRDLILRDRHGRIERCSRRYALKLQRAFAAPDSDCQPFDGDEFLAQARERRRA